MQATLNIVTNPFHPTLDRVQKPIQRKLRINTLVNKHKIDLNKPVICILNGNAVLRKQWGKTTVKDGDVVTFCYLPEGGGGSNPLRLVLMIAVATFAPYIAAPMLGYGVGAGGVALMGTATGFAGAMATLATSAIGMLGNMLINALIPPPQPPKAQQAASLSSPSPTYSIGAQGNAARIGQSVPVLYGRMRVYPDFAAQPYNEFENNDQYLYQLFCITQGDAILDSSSIYIEDTPLTSFGGEYELEVLRPGNVSMLYPTDVYNVSEVSGQEILPGDVYGPYSANPATTTVNKVAFDIVMPRGLYYVEEDGNLATRSVQFTTYATEINDLGIPQGAPIALGTHTISGKTTTAIRRTFRYSLQAGKRYSVSLTRSTPKSTDSRVGDDMVWASARSYSDQTMDYGNKTMVALKLRAGTTISAQSSRKVNVIAQRLLPVPTWNASTSTYDWSAPQVTSSIAHALMDMCRAEYGAGVFENRFAVSELLALHTLWESRGDELNCVFDSSQTFWDALCQVARAGRARPFVQGGMIHFVRDSAVTLPTAMFTSRNIVRGSFKVTYVMPSEDSADCIDVEYFDEGMWKPRIVRASLDGSTDKPAKIKAFGITNRDQAFREGMYAAASNRYRRKEISFDTELEGHIPSLGDLIAIQSDIPEWGQWGEVVSVTLDGATSTIVSSEPFEWTDGANHFMLLRRANGSGTQPIEVAKGAHDAELIFNEADLDFDVYTGFEKERTHISFGREGQVVQLARVLSTAPRERTVHITAVNEDARVHSADGTTIPPDLYEWAITSPSVRPVLQNFNITQVGSGTTPSISLSWLAAPGASRYVIERSTDNENWETLGEITNTSFSFIANTGELFVRVAAFGGVIGPWVTKAYTVGEIPPPANVASGAVTTNGRAFNVSWSAVTDCDGYQVEVLNDGFVKRSFNTLATSYAYTVEQAEGDGGPWREVQFRIKAKKGTVLSEVALVLNGINAAPAAPTLTVNPGAKNISITVSAATDGDYAGTVIHASTTSDFAPAPENKVYEGAGTFYLHQTDVTTYFKAAHYDTYGKEGLNYSTEYSATPQSVVGGSAPDNTPPVAVSGVAVTSKLGTNTLRWTNPNDSTLARVEIWRSTTNDRTTATLIAAELGSVYVDTEVVIGVMYHYWLRTVDFAGNLGPYEPTSSATTYSVQTVAVSHEDLDSNVQFVVEIQQGEVESEHIAAGAVTAEKTKIKRHMIY